MYETIQLGDGAIFRDYNKGEKLGSDRSAGDRARHRKLVRNSIKEGIADIIADESLVGKSRDKIIKVPVKSIKEFRFIYGDNSGGQVGTGDGNTQKGQVVGKTGEKGQGKGDGQAGSDPGAEIYETEITMEELIDILYEDLELPNMKKKNQKIIDSLARRKKDGYRLKGITVRLDKRRTSINRIKRRLASSRYASVDSDVQQPTITNCDSAVAVIPSTYDELISSPGVTVEKVDRFRFRLSDRRYRHMDNKYKPQSNAVILCILDVSGSMDQNKKFLARSFYFVLYNFLQTKYRRCEIVFIAFHTEASEVDEDNFFHKGESGGTFVSSGLNKAIEIINDRYNPSIWNIYTFMMTDGDNFDSDNPAALRTMDELCKLCNMVGYGEIKPMGSRYYESSMLTLFKTVMGTNENFKELLFERKEDIYANFKEFLGDAAND